nr:MBL fold metallo-hydrolase [Angustibacter aerolatus]
MLVTGFPSALFGTNCYVVATAAGEECVVVDPGIEVVGRLTEVLREPAAAAGRGGAHARARRPHVLGDAGVRRPRRGGLRARRRPVPPGRPARRDRLDGAARRARAAVRQGRDLGRAERRRRDRRGRGARAWRACACRCRTRPATPRDR